MPSAPVEERPNPFHWGSDCLVRAIDVSWAVPSPFILELSEDASALCQAKSLLVRFPKIIFSWLYWRFGQALLSVACAPKRKEVNINEAYQS